jgi:hypothetical protein
MNPRAYPLNLLMKSNYKVQLLVLTAVPIKAKYILKLGEFYM